VRKIVLVLTTILANIIVKIVNVNLKLDTNQDVLVTMFIQENVVMVIVIPIQDLLVNLRKVLVLCVILAGVVGQITVI
jgi:hypothetical protein